MHELLTAPDRAILDYAAANALVIVSADTDFGDFTGPPTRKMDPPARKEVWRA